MLCMSNCDILFVICFQILLWYTLACLNDEKDISCKGFIFNFLKKQSVFCCTYTWVKNDALKIS